MALLIALQVLPHPGEPDLQNLKKLVLKFCFSSTSTDEAGTSTPPEPSLWLPDPMTCISAAERVKLGRRKKKGGEREEQEVQHRGENDGVQHGDGTEAGRKSKKVHRR